jgi:hypothetical protein
MDNDAYRFFESPSARGGIQALRRDRVGFAWNPRRAISGLLCELVLSLVSLLGVAMVIAMIVLPLVFARTAAAHHSAAPFDSTAEVAIEGVVTRIDWSSPHVYLTVADRQGRDWKVECNPPGVMTRSGWRRDSLQPKQKVVVHGRPHREPGRLEVLMMRVGTIGPDGKELPVGIPLAPPAQAPRAASLAGLWLGDFPSARPFVEKLLAHPLTSPGRAARAAFRPEMDPSAKCVAWTSPFIVLAAAIYPTRIELNGKTVVLHSEFYDTRRVVHMDRREHPANGKPAPQGDSVGWWEGKTLVVDTRLFAITRSQFRDPYEGLPSGKDKHVVERYTLGADGTTLTVDIRMEDPEYLAEPLSGSFIWRYAPKLPFVGAKCDPKSAAQFLR